MAYELEQILDESKNVLVLQSKDKKIQRVDIFNDDFYKTVNIDSTKMDINLNTLPVGNFVIQAKIDKKWIVMYLEKKKDLRHTSLHQNLILVENQSLDFPIQKAFEIINENDSFFYWVVTESNSSFGSSRTMRLEYKKDVQKLISKAKLELNTSVGKHNKLLVYEVYDRSEFMTKQLRNAEYYKSENSTIFNVIPVYAFMN